MGRKALAWLAVFGLMGVAGAQEVEERRREDVDEARPPDDIPDNMEIFRQTPVSGETPYPAWSEEEEEGTGGAGLEDTGEGEPVEQEPEAEQPEEPRS